MSSQNIDVKNNGKNFLTEKLFLDKLQILSFKKKFKICFFLFLKKITTFFGIFLVFENQINYKIKVFFFKV